MLFYCTDGCIIPVFFRVDLSRIWSVGDGGSGRQNNYAFDSRAVETVRQKGRRGWFVIPLVCTFENTLRALDGRDDEL